MFAPAEFLWALIGLILTIGSTWLEAFAFDIPLADCWRGGGGSIEPYSLGETFQVGAALFTGCMGGRKYEGQGQITKKWQGERRRE